MAQPLRQPPPASPNGLHLHAHHGPHPQHPQINGHLAVQQQQPQPQPQPPPAPQKVTPQLLAQSNEQIWISIGSVTELMGDPDGAMDAYQQALRHNRTSISALNAISCILRTKEQFPQAVEYLNEILRLDKQNGEVWGSLGHCYLMMDNLQEAYQAYQQALYHLRDPKEPKLWYGIGILYDRYGSLDHAEEAFSQVMRMQPNFEKANEIYFRLGIIYKQQQKFSQSLECFRYIVQDPPKPLTEEDIWFQVGHVHEQQKDYDGAKSAYRRVLERDPKHAKVLQQLGWLHHQASSSFSSQEQAIEYLEQSVASDQSDAQSWYLLGRCYMSQQKFSKAYEAYQQAVYRDGRNPTFWCSIGVLYYQINQYRDALDAYSRAIRLNPYISEVWYDLGTLYESCNNQTSDALDAYQRAADLDPTNVHIKNRLNLLRSAPQGQAPPGQPPPPPQDIHPHNFQSQPGGQWGLPGGPGGPGGPAGGPPQPQQPPPPPHPAEWGRSQPPVGPQQSFPHEQRVDPRSGPPAPLRQPSPRTGAGYPEPGRGPPGPPRAPSPARPPHVAGLHNGPGPAPNPYAGAQALPQPQPPQPSQGRPRISNPNYGNPAAPGGMPQGPGPTQAGPHGGPMPPPGRGHSPPPEIRPIQDDRNMRSPHDSNLSGPSYGGPQHNLDGMQRPAIMAGSAPTSALAAAEAQAQRDSQRERDDPRPPTGLKRLNDDQDSKWGAKKPASEENRGRLEDHHYRRDSPRDQPRSPGRRRDSSERRREEQRRANENYHPSEAAHHPPPAMPAPAYGAPPTAQGPPPPQQATPVPGPAPGPPPQRTPIPAEHQQVPPPPGRLPMMTPDGGKSAAPAREERKSEIYEPAARKMEIDDDYDDAGPDDKKGDKESKADVNGVAKSES